MNYPIWEVPGIGSPWVIGLTAILHVFVSHFAVGGGAYLWLTERKAVREGNEEMRAHVRRYTKLFYYITTVFGAITGVGIWFSIGLVNAAGTSTLIHTFVWFWAIEWVFFAVEIGTIMVYHYGWDRMSKEAHVKLGRFYFIVSVQTLFIINGILTFMLTPGAWLEDNSDVWGGFFNETFLPSFILRLAFMVGIAGVWGVAVATRIKDNETLRTKLVRFSASYAIPMMLVIPFAILWYLLALPEPVTSNLALGVVAPAAGNFSILGRVLLAAGILSMIVMLLIFVGPYMNPRNATTKGAVFMLLIALFTMGMSEYTREAARKPYVIYGYMYSNGVLVEDVPKVKDNFLEHAKWAYPVEAGWQRRAPEEQIFVGEELFRLQCMACHTANGYRSMSKLLDVRDETAIRSFLDMIKADNYDKPENSYRNYMPPFLGNEAEKAALAAYLRTLNKDNKPGLH